MLMLEEGHSVQRVSGQDMLNARHAAGKQTAPIPRV